MSPALDFPQMSATFNSGMNAFMEANVAGRVASVLGTLADLSNNDSTDPNSQGDFKGAVATCPVGGCGFFVNDTTTSFGSRLRGYLAVTSAMVATPVHFGFFADDAVSLSVFDATATAYPVVTQPPVLGSSAWRVTSTVTFGASGLYPVEILYAQIVEGAALEVSTFSGAFTDRDSPANQVPVTSLATAGFALVSPSMFYQTASGEPSFVDLTQCVQCDRQFAGGMGTSGCSASQHCNAAALCAPCDDVSFCGRAAPCSVVRRAPA